MWEEHILGKALGAGGVVYPWPGMTLLLTAGFEKEAHIFQASFCGFSTPGMAISSIHQQGISNWWACKSNQVSTSLMEGSEGKLSPLLAFR